MKSTILTNEEMNEHPVVKLLKQQQPVFWENSYKVEGDTFENALFTLSDLEDAADRLERFRSYFRKAFKETLATDGLIESPLVSVSNFQNKLAETYANLPPKLWIKCDSHLPISGSIKARGGFYEVLKHAETLALQAGLLKPQEDYSIFDSEHYRHFFNQYTIAVGSTGNLGLSIGIMSASLGFKVKVHMSSDAKAWKKALLRKHGAEVFEYADDYSAAVAAGRKISDEDPNSYFIDDEHSRDLFLGYTVAGRRLEAQLEEQNIVVSAEKPLYVYLPCGVGGGPGGVAYGLKQIYGDNVHCYFIEPTHSPCMLLGISTQTHEAFSVQDFGIDNVTLADGLAVGRASGLVSRIMTPILDGLFTVEDSQLLEWLKLLYETEGLKLEPSALAGVAGPTLLSSDESLIKQRVANNTQNGFENATHVIWATGGNMVPKADFELWI